MQETEKGPLLTDETFFHNCLDLGRQEMKEVRYFAENHDYVQARRALAAVLRSGLAKMCIRDRNREQPAGLQMAAVISNQLWWMM